MSHSEPLLRAAQRHSRGTAVVLRPKFFAFATIFRQRPGLKAQILIASPGLKAEAPTVRRKRRVNSIAACRAVPHVSLRGITILPGRDGVFCFPPARSYCASGFAGSQSPPAAPDPPLE